LIEKSKSVFFNFTPSVALDNFTRLLENGFIGYINITTLPCDDIISLLFEYTAQKTYVAYLVRNQLTFTSRVTKLSLLRNEIIAITHKNLGLCFCDIMPKPYLYLLIIFRVSDLSEDAQPCCICLERISNVLITKCMHFVMCEECSNHPKFENNCPLCRQIIIGKVNADYKELCEWRNL
jgi:hypothetical protein